MKYSYLNKIVLGISTSSNFVEITDEFINSLT